MADILQKIAAYKREEVAALKSRISLSELEQRANEAAEPKEFTQALQNAKGPALIAEVKKASPSKGVIREVFDPVAIAKAYQSGGASCLSVLTDGPSFQGSEQIFADVRHAVDLPLLRKDFLVDPIQVIESRAMGADCILIIMAMIDDAIASELFSAAEELGMDALIETHDIEEMERAAKLGGKLIGINNRDLRTFETTLKTFKMVSDYAPSDAVLIAESGIFTRDDVKRLNEWGAQGYLVGESLMRQDDVESAVKQLIG